MQSYVRLVRSDEGSGGQNPTPIPSLNAWRNNVIWLIGTALLMGAAIWWESAWSVTLFVVLGLSLAIPPLLWVIVLASIGFGVDVYHEHPIEEAWPRWGKMALPYLSEFGFVCVILTAIRLAIFE